MNLYSMLRAKAAAGQAVRVGLIGAGKFGSMFLSQAKTTAGIHVVGVADISPQRARASFARVGWPEEKYAAKSMIDAVSHGTTHILDNAEALISFDGIDVIIDATGIPGAGVQHALWCCEHGRHMVMVNVEADVLAGPLLAKRAASAGIVYSMAYGDQPALIAELVDWARAIGLEPIAAGKGTKYLPVYSSSTPDTVWDHYGFTKEQLAAGDFNARMFNSFLDGTKSALEMAAVANATGLSVPRDGLLFPPCGVDDLASVLRPRSEGGILESRGMVEVVSSLERDGRPVYRDLRWGVYVVFDAPTDYVQRCFSEYGVRTDSSGRYAALYRPYHLIGLELGISVASAALRREPTGSVREFAGDVAATAKRKLLAGEKLDGEGGYTVVGKALPARHSLSERLLPIGLAHEATLVRDIEAGQPVRWSDVVLDEGLLGVRVRREMEAQYRADWGLENPRMAAS
ncbi:flagellar biosynthesis protein FlgA [Mesorhizobium sp. CU2]|uniref:NAD(P)H-dependent oxidoreductase n=1 Tax=unclassified Mesorhizobium TaxID=325217 RepID=UPI001128FF62|nr:MULTISPECIES: SAF domain-containing protein [unclassified Mesorhizobium]TPN81058.1 flagellar biosynthesis protein FlgA [Mesorhizobium sp. CU3]TPO09813.1 flagellar biosynthesis protein FlgA [Mesorhizobium sp. CU2]